jgi:7-cyano-7-deazaguanine synthase
MSTGPTSAIVLFSGGQDSTTCLAWALSRFQHVETVGFDYGQRHAAELAARPRILDRLRGFSEWGKRLGDDHLLPLDVLKAIGGSALTDDMRIEMGESGLPTTFVPGRNVMFLTAAAALVDLIVEETVTCYEGDRSHRHDWGYGCGRCPACELRAGGYAKYRAA